MDGAARCENIIGGVDTGSRCAPLRLYLHGVFRSAFEARREPGRVPAKVVDAEAASPTEDDIDCHRAHSGRRLSIILQLQEQSTRSDAANRERLDHLQSRTLPEDNTHGGVVRGSRPRHGPRTLLSRASNTVDDSVQSG